MNPKFNAAAIKCLEAAKLIQTVKDPQLKKYTEDATILLTQIAAELLSKDPKITNKDK